MIPFIAFHCSQTRLFDNSGTGTFSKKGLTEGIVRENTTDVMT